MDLGPSILLQRRADHDVPLEVGAPDLHTRLLQLFHQFQGGMSESIGTDAHHRAGGSGSDQPGRIRSRSTLMGNLQDLHPRGFEVALGDPFHVPRQKDT